MSDDEILVMIADPRQREQGFRCLMEAYQERLYHHVRRMVVEHADAADVLQNTLVKVYRHIDRFRGQSQLYTWLYRIATNEALTFLERQKRQITALKQTDEEAAFYLQRLPAEVELDSRQVQQLLQEAIALLPPRQRMVFSLRYFEEMTYQEMAGMLEVSEGGLKANYHHAVKKIELFLREHS